MHNAKASPILKCLPVHIKLSVAIEAMLCINTHLLTRMGSGGTSFLTQDGADGLSIIVKCWFLVKIFGEPLLHRLTINQVSPFIQNKLNNWLNRIWLILNYFQDLTIHSILCWKMERCQECVKYPSTINVSSDPARFFSAITSKRYNILWNVMWTLRGGTLRWPKSHQRRFWHVKAYAWNPEMAQNSNHSVSL